MTIYKKILIGLLVVNLLCGCYLLFKAVTHTEYDCTGYYTDCGNKPRPDMGAAFAALLVTAISLFLPVLLITLIDHVEGLEAITGSLQGRVIRLEREAGILPPPIGAKASESSRPAEQGSLSSRLGKL